MKISRVLSIALYTVGSAITAVCLYLTLFGSPERDYTLMLAYNIREQAFVWLAMGFIPMALSSVWLYASSGSAALEKRPRRRRLALIALPALVCGVCFVYVAGVFALGMANVLFSAIGGG